MSKLQVFEIYDLKGLYYDRPFFMKSKGDALREWQTVANDESTKMGKFPEDFCLYHIGEFDEQTGKIDQFKNHVSLGKAAEYKKIIGDEKTK